MTGCSVPNSWKRGLRVVFLLCLFAWGLPGCGPSWSPVENRSGQASSYQLTADGHYLVRRGDSLYTIAFRMGLDWRDLAKWNDIGAPYTIYPDQQLRLSPAPARAGGNVVTRPAKPPAAAVSTEQGTSVPRAQSRTLPATASTASATPAKPPPAAPAPSPVTAPMKDPGTWLWPAEGRLLSTFKPNDPSRNGIEIGGKEGQPVICAAAGEVVYSGSGLIGYGELIIVKHSDRMLSAYAHNRKRLVSEGQKVAAGERLAEMGRDDRNQPMLHFEIRVNGTPQDPLKFLPGR
ncbi:MAG: peptidoglycan DD-metalloendopeptidase family protein [Xanthomonadales bacterium]|jgi:lipoprotein NlpD|nr:peptidoglycan DD-metalloendopeptidase family protein [Xanthomonadales bacterium]